jgi:hypothetical protein
MMTEEDEAFNEIERRAKQRKEAVRATTQAWKESASDYERGFIDGMQKQAQSSVDKAVNAMSQRTWVGLTDEEIWTILQFRGYNSDTIEIAKAVEAKLKEKNT